MVRREKLGAVHTTLTNSVIVFYAQNERKNQDR